MSATQICLVGYESMVLFKRPRVYLWLASEGWEKCFEVEAVPIPGVKEIGIQLTRWNAGTILPDWTPN